MTAHKHLKARIRARMHRTGESYMTARHIVLSARPGNTSDGTADAALDLGGVTPEAATLRVLLTAVGATAPHTGQPWSEAMLFGLTGGVGVAVHTFRYERDDVSTLFVGARRPDIADGMVAGLDRLGIAHTVHETAGARTAATQLRGALTAYGPVAAWVDAATLGTRGMPASWEGGAYHVLAVLGVDDDAGTATLADLTAAPVVVASEQLDAARARIRKQRHRVLAVTAVPDEDVGLDAAVRDAIEACHATLTGGRARAMRIDALDDLAARMVGDGRDGWAQMFPPGRHLWTALTSLHLFVEHYGTGRGLSRPLYAAFLREVASATGVRGADEAAEHYDDLGRQWRALAVAALPDGIDLLAQARRLQDERAALYAASGAGAVQRLSAIWQRLDALGAHAADAFPLDADGAAGLRAELARRMRLIAAAERDAATLLERVADG
ncbi:MAG TPA: DUF4872 domain-containing protein [Euzebyales bacterium]